MAIQHVAEKNITNKLVGGLMFGSDQGLLLNADLATTKVAAKAAVTPRAAKLHTSQRTFEPRVQASLDLIDQYDSTYFGGSLVAKPTALALTQPPYRGRTLRF